MRRHARVRKSPRTSQELAAIVRERDVELKENGPITERTPFGLWQYGPGGTSTTTYDTPPHRMTSKGRYR